MAHASVRVQLSIPEIYEHLCEKCKKKIRALIKEKISKEMISQVIGDAKK